MPYRHVTDVSQLKRGDHICWDRVLYQHHAIVEKVNPHRQQICVVHYCWESQIKPIIQQEWVPLSQRCSNISHVLRPSQSAPVSMYDPLYVVLHDEITSSPDDAMARARSRIGEEEYNMLTNNCESFATWCKIGRNESPQAEKGAALLVAMLGASTQKEKEDKR